MEQLMDYTKQDLLTVVRWLEDQHMRLESQRLIIENGDDFAFLNGKGDRVHDLRANQSAVKHVQHIAADQLGQADASRG